MQCEEGCPAAVSVVSMPRLDLDALAWRTIRHHGRSSTGDTRKTREHGGTKGYKQLPSGGAKMPGWRESDNLERGSADKPVLRTVAAHVRQHLVSTACGSGTASAVLATKPRKVGFGVGVVWSGQEGHQACNPTGHCPGEPRPGGSRRCPTSLRPLPSPLQFLPAVLASSVFGPVLCPVLSCSVLFCGVGNQVLSVPRCALFAVRVNWFWGLCVYSG